ncbi:MAG: toxin-antitoxin system HicB family antitoxin [Oscillospiraceae bacterium]|jgi:predicted HicB family RNase H-like nuclease|nr:toxin-antitoxin system HicB family antitoxin [Oscillospiraceae bacterium]
MRKQDIDFDKYLCYKGYYGSVLFAADSGVFHGRLLGIRSSISYEGENMDGLVADFKISVDDYLKSCEFHGNVPEIPFEGEVIQFSVLNKALLLPVIAN